MSLPRVVVLRGHSANPWELATWELLRDRFDVHVAVTGSNRYALEELGLPRLRVRARRDLLPRGRVGDLAALAVGDGYRGLAAALRGADVVHAAELGIWVAGQPARLRRELGFRLVTTVWETIPFRETFRGFRGRADRRDVLAAADLFLAATERARSALLLEGVEERRIVVAGPGIDVARFAGAAAATTPEEHLLVSPGRLVWEKGHYDVLRAAARQDDPPRVLLVGAGPERERLLRYAGELGIGDRVEARAVPYAEMPGVFARASCVVLASLGIPLWEEQFGMVLVEALAAGAPLLASSSGAIPEVLGGTGVPLFAPGDWVGLADALRDGPLARPPGTRERYPAEVVERHGTAAAADRLAAAYARVLSER